MAPVLAADDGSISLMPIWIELLVLLFLLAPVIAGIAAWRSRRRAKAAGVPRTTLATAGLTLVRIFGGLLIFAAVWIVLTDAGLVGEQTSRGIGDRVEVENGYFDGYGRSHDERRLVLSVETNELPTLCPSKWVRVIVDGREETHSEERRCWARRYFEEQYGAGVDVGHLQLTKTILNPPASVLRSATALSLITVASLGLVLFGIERILRLATLRRPFDPASGRWLRVVAAGVAGLTILVPLLTDRIADRLVLDYMGDAGRRAVEGEAPPIWFEPFLGVLLVLVVAEIWRFGIRLQQDAEATV